MIPIIIVTYETDALVPLVEALNHYSEGPVHIADNGNHTSTKELAHKHSWDYTPLENLGYGKAFNHVVKNYLENMTGCILANDDLRLDNAQLDTFAQLTNEVVSANPKSGPIAPVYVNKVMKMENVKPVEVDFNAAALWFISSECLKTVGGLHPDFFMYAEDKEYCYRARYHGFKPIVLDGFYVNHPFDYPPSSITMWSHMIKNTLKAIVLDVNQDRESAFFHGFKMLVLSAFTGQFRRFNLTLGALLTLITYSFSIRSKRKFLTKAHPYRFVKA